jgi:LysM repeat protein
MYTPNPLIPQGTQPPRGKSSFFFKVLLIMTVHVLVIGGLLLQGCKDTKVTGAVQPGSDAASNATSPPIETIPTVAATSTEATTSAPQNLTQMPPPVAPQPQITQPAPLLAPPSPAPTVIAATTPAATPDAREYVVVAGDTLAAIAHKNGVAIKTLVEANPGVNPKKLHIGLKLQLPASAIAIASTPRPAASAAPDAASNTVDSTVYKVKSGDTLAKIARLHHTSYQKIMAMNDLKTPSVRPGQILKLPAPKAAGTANPESATAIVPLQQTAPAVTTAATTPSVGAN